MKKDKKQLYGVIAAVVIIAILAISMSNTNFSVLGGEEDIIYETDSAGNTYPVKITYNDYTCEDKTDCINTFSALSSAADVQESSDSIFCREQICVVDFR